ncbi:MAG: hypothetical protein C4K58_00455 [Flavobacteriaceae bacterium]|nr:MAG: hypothetical protein C4K58_00455 [Flavobacteriaceae bacterium]
MAISFYYWKTKFQLSPKEEELLKFNQVQNIYVRYFDIDKKLEDPFPESPIQFDSSCIGKTITPVVFIKNRVFQGNKISTQTLAKNTLDFVHQISQLNKINTSNVIQIDCDWTDQTRSSFFEYIHQLERISKEEITTTIRLHQVKYYKKTGIPSVKEGMLMYYNMGNLSVFEGNSIYKKENAGKYIQSLENYPLPLKVALPIFSWAIHIRNNRIIGLNSNVTRLNLAENANVVLLKPNFYKVHTSHYFQGVFFRKADILKMEEVTPKDLLEMVEDLQKHLPKKPTEIVFYHLDNQTIKNYEKDIFKQVVSAF